jgi:hypothetical protein
MQVKDLGANVLPPIAGKHIAEKQRSLLFFLFFFYKKKQFDQNVLLCLIPL